MRSSSVRIPADIALRRVAGLQRHRLEMEGLDQWHLSNREDRRQRNYTKSLEADPEGGALGAPDDLVQDRHRKKEQGPAQREDSPALRGQVEHLIEHDGDEG